MIVFHTSHDSTTMLPDGKLTREHAPPSGSWVMTGAVEYGRGYIGGRVVRHYTLDDIRGGRVPWFWKNGKQRCYPTDIDHGTHRVWMSPPLISVTGVVKHRFVLIQGQSYPLDTKAQQRVASRKLSEVGYNSARVWCNGVSTQDLLLADSDVDPVENGTKR